MKRKKQLDKIKKSINPLESCMSRSEDFKQHPNIKIINAKENKWLSEPKKLKLTKVNNTNKLYVFCLIIVS